MAMQWIETDFGGRWVDPQAPAFDVRDLSDGVGDEDPYSTECPHCGERCYDGWNCPECGEPLMW